MYFDRESKSVIPLQARPVRNLFKATLANNLKLFQSALAKDLHPLHEKIGWEKSISALSRRFADDLGDYQLSDFRFRYEGDQSSGHYRPLPAAAAPGGPSQSRDRQPDISRTLTEVAAGDIVRRDRS